MKKFFTFFAAALMSVSMWALTPLDGDSWNDATKTLTVNSNPAKSAYISQSEIEHLIIGNAVTNIGESAFESCTNLTSVTFGDQLTTLEQYAFCACYALTSVELPNSLTKIVSGAFAYCGALASVTIGTGITKIEAFAFMDCGITSLTCQATNPPTLDYRTFNGCTSLSQIYVPAESLNTYKTATNWSAYASIIKAIGNEDQPAWVQPGDEWDEDTKTLTVNSNPVSNAYMEKSEINHVIISDGVTNIGNSTFAYCYYISSIVIPNTVTKIEDYAFYYCSSLAAIDIPNSVDSIGASAFAYCSFAQSLTIGDGVTFIDDYAFYYCDDIASFTMGNNVQSIGKHAFSLCTSIPSVVLPNSVETIGENAFYYCSAMSSLTIGNSVTNIGKFTFGNCTSLTAVDIPNSVQTIGNSAFRSCSALSSLTIGTGVTYIGERAFNECYGLTSLEIPDNVETIDYNAFTYCSALTSVKIGTGVTAINDGAFYGCSAMTDITIEAVNPPVLGNEVFYSCPALAYIFVPEESVETYKAAEYWSEYAEKIRAITDQPIWLQEGDTWDADTKTLTVNSNPGEGAYANNTEIEHVIISEGVTSIAREAFYYCSALTTIELPASIESIGDYAFQGCPAIVSVTCKALNPPTMGDGIFYDSSALEHIYVPAWSVDAYKAATEWSLNAAIIELIPGTEAIGQITNDQSQITNKVIKHGHLIINKNGKAFNALGARVR